MFGITTFMVYAANKLIPEDVKNFQITIVEEKIDCIRGEKIEVFFEDDRDGIFEINGGMVKFTRSQVPGEVSLSPGAVVESQENWENEIPVKVDPFGMPIKIVRGEKEIILEQEDGMFASFRTIIKWDNENGNITETK